MQNVLKWFTQWHDQLNLFDTSTDAPPVQKRTAPRTHAVRGEQREVSLQGQTVAYRLIRAMRQSIGMRIDNEGLVVRAAPHVSVDEVERVLQSKARWILKHLHDPNSHRRHREPLIDFVPNLDVADGATLSLLGQVVAIRWDDWCAQASHFETDLWGHPVIWVKTPRSTRKLTPSQASAKRQNAVAQALGEYLLDYVRTRAQEYAHAYQLSYNTIELSNAKTLWGTCRRDGLIRLNWRLVFLEQSLVDYVLAHELAHTRHMNHSAHFWQQVAHMCPNYQALRRALHRYDLRRAP